MDCMDRREPNKLEGLEDLEAGRTFRIGDAGSFELASESLRCSGDDDVIGGVDEKREEGRIFLRSTPARTGAESGGRSSIGVSPEPDGLKMVKLFRRRLSPMVATCRCLPGSRWRQHCRPSCEQTHAGSAQDLYPKIL